MVITKKEHVLNEEHESLESVFLSTLEHDVTPVENEASGDVNDADSAAGEQPSSHLIQRAVVYGTLVIFLLVALNDYRLRTAWESEYQTLADSLIHSKGLPQETSTPELVELMATRKGVDSWLEKRGYELTKDRAISCEFLRRVLEFVSFGWLLITTSVAPRNPQC